MQLLHFRARINFDAPMSKSPLEFDLKAHGTWVENFVNGVTDDLHTWETLTNEEKMESLPYLTALAAIADARVETLRARAEAVHQARISHGAAASAAAGSSKSSILQSGVQAMLDAYKKEPDIGSSEELGMWTRWLARAWLFTQDVGYTRRTRDALVDAFLLRLQHARSSTAAASSTSSSTITHPSSNAPPHAMSLAQTLFKDGLSSIFLFLCGKLSNCLPLLRVCKSWAAAVKGPVFRFSHDVDLTIGRKCYDSMDAHYKAILASPLKSHITQFGRARCAGLSGPADPFNGAVLSLLHHLPHLTDLSMRFEIGDLKHMLTTIGMEEIIKLCPANLRSLTFKVRYGDDWRTVNRLLQIIGSMTTVKALTLELNPSYTELTRFFNFTPLRQLPALASFHPATTLLTLPQIDQVRGMPALTSISRVSVVRNSLQLAHFCRSPPPTKLQRISLDHIVAPDIEHLQHLPSLTHLSAMSIAGDALVMLPQLTSVSFFKLFDPRPLVTAQPVLLAIKSLALDGVTEAIVAALPTCFPKLTELCLSGVNNLSLAGLSALPLLDTLALDFGNTSEETIQSLHGIKQLRDLFVRCVMLKGKYPAAGIPRPLILPSALLPEQLTSWEFGGWRSGP